MAKEKLTRNQMLRKQRITRIFIDAAKEIAGQKGLQGITIRNVAELAGYNSATLYNYFENLEALIAFTAIDMVRPWIDSGSQIYRENEDVLDRYIGGWISFCRHAFEEPEGFVYIYGGENRDIAPYFRAYAAIFVPEEEESIYHDLYEQTSLVEQEIAAIRPCVEAGYFREEDAEEIYSLALLLFDGLLWRVMRERDAHRAEEHTQSFLRYFLEYLHPKLQIEKDLSGYLK